MVASQRKLPPGTPNTSEAESCQTDWGFYVSADRLYFRVDTSQTVRREGHSKFDVDAKKTENGKQSPPTPYPKNHYTTKYITHDNVINQFYPTLKEKQNGWFTTDIDECKPLFFKCVKGLWNRPLCYKLVHKLCQCIKKILYN